MKAATDAIKAAAKAMQSPPPAPASVSPAKVKENAETITKLIAQVDSETEMYNLFDEVPTVVKGKMKLDTYASYLFDYLPKKGIKLRRELINSIPDALKCYDKDKSGTIERAEFEPVYFDSIMVCIKDLTNEYAIGKAAILKSQYKKQADGLDGAGADKMITLAYDTQRFFKELKELADKFDKENNYNGAVEMGEFHKLLEALCKKFKLTVLQKDHINEILNETGQSTSSYSMKKLRLPSMTIFMVASNLSKQLA